MSVNISATLDNYDYLYDLQIITVILLSISSDDEVSRRLFQLVCFIASKIFLILLLIDRYVYLLMMNHMMQRPSKELVWFSEGEDFTLGDVVVGTLLKMAAANIKTHKVLK